MSRASPRYRTSLSCPLRLQAHRLPRTSRPECAPWSDLRLSLRYKNSQKIGLEDRLEGQEVFGSMTPLRMHTSCLMGMVMRRGTRYILTPNTTDLPPN